MLYFLQPTSEFNGKNGAADWTNNRTDLSYYLEFVSCPNKWKYSSNSSMAFLQDSLEKRMHSTHNICIVLLSFICHDTQKQEQKKRLDSEPSESQPVMVQTIN